MGALGAVFGGNTIKVLVEIAVPPGPVTAMDPVLAPLGTVVESWAAVRAPRTAEVPPKVTAVTVSRFVPVSVTAVPVEPLVGEMLVMVGAGVGVGGFPPPPPPPPLHDIKRPRPRAAPPCTKERNQADGLKTDSKGRGNPTRLPVDLTLSLVKSV